ncbi:hypothetical protein LTR99_006526 [Exophiala xenobiotica]|uniref:F-box domain-containing protein n=1 Tax=Vermiconidia calcicola TaxID=1690605 RepID=A0AAV9QCU3_9PEZI|nr:hypothetical protein LTR72_008274 [Exophiala xenobiotica]KAK5535634.1 hypothetical protein LTR23_008228 [Chaetothyriales sp. CCFEE 6169]KAK5537696.1 hypothetical protein LTR25_004948 [Vermiconidia calcicola]KAK5267339.1 hypothetical protein LTR96_007372 [Exophiala xenobiotica]KAK5291425.1 hypothetical protein LTR14_005999 [Exophiala xenobiotica]
MSLVTKKSPVHLSTLPPEILHQILAYLPISSLLRLARTCKKHYSTSIQALQKLQLAVLPRRVHGILAFLSATNVDELDYACAFTGQDSLGRNQIIITSHLPVPNPTMRGRWPQPHQYREKLIHFQNALACSALSSSSLVNLQSLTLHMYDIRSAPLTELLATRFPHLRHLHLNFSHPYVHDTCLPARQWESPLLLRGSPVWNALVGMGEKHESNLKLRSLERLTLDRAGITCAQLRRWIKNNPGLRELTLRNCLGPDNEFVEWLGGYYSSKSIKSTRHAKLTHLVIENCTFLWLDSPEKFDWLDSLLEAGPEGEQHYTTTNGCDNSSTTALQVLSFHLCPSVSTFAFLQYLDKRRPVISRIGLANGRALVRRETDAEYPPKEEWIGKTKLSTVRVAIDSPLLYFSDFPMFSYFRGCLAKYRAAKENEYRAGIRVGHIEPDTR